MLRVLCRLLFTIIVTNFSFAQDNKKDILFVGHAYGSHEDYDQQLDPVFKNFIKKNSDIFDQIVLGGDFIYDCNDNIEIQSFKNVFESYNVRFVIGNHETCDKIIHFANQNFGGTNYYEKINESLIFYLNTSIDSFEESDFLYNYLNEIIRLESPKNILIFTHQLIFSKSDFEIRTNSRKYYKYGNNFFDKVLKKYNNSSKRLLFFSGDIGAYNFTPYAYYDTNDNFEFYASGLGNNRHNKGLLIKVSENIEVKFIDLDSGAMEPLDKYSKIKVQFYQFPKLFLSRLKKFIFPSY